MSGVPPEGMATLPPAHLHLLSTLEPDCYLYWTWRAIRNGRKQSPVRGRLDYSPDLKVEPASHCLMNLQAQGVGGGEWGNLYTVEKKLSTAEHTGRTTSFVALMPGIVDEDDEDADGSLMVDTDSLRDLFSAAKELVVEIPIAAPALKEFFTPSEAGGGSSSGLSPEHVAMFQGALEEMRAMNQRIGVLEQALAAAAEGAPQAQASDLEPESD